MSWTPKQTCAPFAEPHLGALFLGQISRRIDGNAHRIRPFRSCSRRWSPPHQNPYCLPLRKAAKPLETSLIASSRDHLYSAFSSCRAAARSNINEDTDDMFDDLFKKYGKVVYRSNDQKTQDAEVDDDAQSLSFAVEMAKVANEVKAADIRVLFVKPLVYWTRFFIVVTGFSHPQIDAIKTKMKDLAEGKFGKIASGDSKPDSWTIVDFGDVVVHIFLPEQRAFYNLEEFYGNATAIELPFEDQQQFRF
ncbi:hypothetical protein Dimus_021043 [Dionaea muscipula]